MASSPPPIALFVRSKDGAQLLSGAPELEALPDAPIGAASSAVFSADGRFMAVLDARQGGVRVHANGGDWRVLAAIERPAVTAVAFSPRSTFLVTWEKLVDGSDGNLLVWRLAPPAGGAAPGAADADGGRGAAVVSRFKQKNFARDKWPSTPWTSDEALSAQLVTNEIHFYDGTIGPGAGPVSARLKLAGVSKFALAPAPSAGSGGPYRLATFVPEQKGGPALVRVYEHPQLEPGAYVATKSFYKAQHVELKWAPSGCGLLVQTHTDEDKSGRSYYGESNLFWLPASSAGKGGKGEGNVPRVKEGPIHDVAWCPTADTFIVVHGFMPAAIVLYDTQFTPLFSFGGEAARNTVRWCPHGHLVALGGFGNVGGGLELWDVERKARLACVDAHMTVGCEWTADSNFLLTSTLFPRLRVENGYRLWRPDGTVAKHALFTELEEATLAPAPHGAHPKPPPVKPGPTAAAAAGGAGGAGGGAAAKPQKYVPPSRRGQAGSTAGYDIHAYDPATDRAGTGPAAARSGLPVGADPEDAKRGRKGKKPAGGAAGGGAGGGAAGGAAPAGGGAAGGTAGGAAADGPSDSVKKARALQKKIRQIAELREAQEAGKVLEKNQLDKIASEDALLAELQALELKVEEESKTGMWR